MMYDFVKQSNFTDVGPFNCIAEKNGFMAASISLLETSMISRLSKSGNLLRNTLTCVADGFGRAAGSNGYLHKWFGG
jgi:hypothetical protein